MTSHAIKIRLMQPADIDSAMRLKHKAGWNQTIFDWETFLALSPNACFVAEYNHKIIGTVTILQYETDLTWIGMLLVDPQYRGIGIGTKLMRQALNISQRFESIKLDATPAGRSIYATLGFQDEYSIARMTIDALPTDSFTELRPSVHPITDHDFEKLNEIDKHVFGTDRSALLKRLQNQYPHYASIIKYSDSIRGYCFGRDGTNYFQIGPVVASTDDDAILLLFHAFHTLQGNPCIIDIPIHHLNVLNWLTDIGFAEQRLFYRMYYKHNIQPESDHVEFAIAGPEYG